MSHPIMSCPIQLHPFPSRPVRSCQAHSVAEFAFRSNTHIDTIPILNSNHNVLSRSLPVLLRPVSLRPVPSRLVLSYRVLSYTIASCPVLSGHVTLNPSQNSRLGATNTHTQQQNLTVTTKYYQYLLQRN